MAKYKFDGRYLTSASGLRIGELVVNAIKNEGGAKIGIIDGDIIKNARGIKVGSFDGNNIKDHVGNRVGGVADVARSVNGTIGMPIVAMWWFFVR
ncbi:MAG: hypothetical protein IPH85_14100 [Ignavibacteria bacterium]|nr:hypothetical protein [Ignavibacteria bacterium]MBP6509960.1 hypothetical protein [Candidatus Kapabacteria bacterium]MBK6420255.1 hypothetical protein [Ignavibacteria bacterium]MBK6759111.1 hypothetical protein [Ignavibacteria bacterium]MBK7034470.1 hypothetical protein [Ignavibacteria bacterium]